MNLKQIITFLLAISAVIYFTINARKQMEKIENKYETVDNDPLKARVYTLENGLKVYLTSYKDAPRIQTNIAVRAGSKNDPNDATGLAHYLEHMLFKGTDIYGTLDYENEKILLDKVELLYEEYRSVDMNDKERRNEIALIKKYEDDLETIKNKFNFDNKDLCRGLSNWPLSVKGFGHVKAKNMNLALLDRNNIIQNLANPNRNIKAAE